MGSFIKFVDHLGVNKIVVNHRQTANTLNARVHHQIGRILTAHGVCIVDMIVHRFLIPLFRHLQQEEFRKESTHNAWIAGRHFLEIVNQTELLFFIAACANNLLHELNQHS